MAVSSLALILAAAVVPAVPVNLPSPLNVGDAAPALRVAKWLKGQPVDLTGEGIYVVHFWATSFTPGTSLFADFSKLAQEYEGKVVFLAVNVEKREAGEKDEPVLARAAKFVADSGKQAGYPVAADGPGGFMRKNWLEAAGEEYPGAVFIVGRGGKIAWIGSSDVRPRQDCMPSLWSTLYDLESPWIASPENVADILQKLLKGSLDVKALAQDRAKVKRLESMEKDVLDQVRAQLNQLKGDGALAIVEKALAEQPALRQRLCLVHLALLQGKDERRAAALIKELAGGQFKNDPEKLRLMANSLLFDSEYRTDVDFALAVTLMERVNKLGGGKNAYDLAGVARAHFKNGAVAKAVAIQEKAIEQAIANFGRDEKTLKQFRAELAKYKDKLK